MYLNVGGIAGQFMTGLYDGTNYQEVIHQGSWNNNQWHHAAMVVSPTAMELFLDGTGRGTVGHDNSMPLNTATFNLGRQNDSAGYCNGSLDDVRICNRALIQA
jgi:hypothetical protein